MRRPSRAQWLILWLGTVWIIATLVVADDSVVRGVFAAVLVTGLLYFQVGTRAPVARPEVPASSPLPDDPLSTAETAESASVPDPVELVGVGGWLVVLVFVLGIVAPLSALGEIVRSARDADSAWEFGGALVALSLMAPFAIYAALGLSRRWPRAPRTAQAYFVVSGALHVVGMATLMFDSVNVPELVGQTIGGSLGAILWVLYLQKSRRVKNTYLPSDHDWSSPPAIVWPCIAFLFLLIFGIVQFRSAQESVESEFSQITPREFVTVARSMDSAFDADFTSAVVKRQGEAISNSTISTNGPSTFTEVNGAFRSIVMYQAEIGVDASTATNLVGEVRSYFHDDGIVSVESACIPALIECAGMTTLLEEAEGALLSRLAGTQISGILPAGRCEVDTVSGDRGSSEVVTCSYANSGGASLSITRLDRDGAMVGLRQLAVTSAQRRTIVEAIRAIRSQR